MFHFMNGGNDIQIELCAVLPYALGGGSLMTSQYKPSCLMASENWLKSTGFLI